MNQAARITGTVSKTISTEAGDLFPVQEPVGIPPMECLVPLVHKLVELQREQIEGLVVAFTATTSGTGVTHIVESLAWELARHTREQILMTTPQALSGIPAATADESQQRVHRLMHRGSQGAHRLEALGREDLQSLRKRFSFVLVDSPALKDSPDYLSLAGAVDGFVLVVLAGRTKRAEIEWAQKVLAASSANLIGLVLNNRPEPLPQLLSWGQAREQLAGTVRAFSNRPRLRRDTE